MSKKNRQQQAAASKTAPAGSGSATADAPSSIDAALEQVLAEANADTGMNEPDVAVSQGVVETLDAPAPGPAEQLGPTDLPPVATVAAPTTAEGAEGNDLGDQPPTPPGGASVNDDEDDDAIPMVELLAQVDVVRHGKTLRVPPGRIEAEAFTDAELASLAAQGVLREVEA